MAWQGLAWHWEICGEEREFERERWREGTVKEVGIQWGWGKVWRERNRGRWKGRKIKVHRSVSGKGLIHSSESSPRPEDVESAWCPFQLYLQTDWQGRDHGEKTPIHAKQTITLQWKHWALGSNWDQMCVKCTSSSVFKELGMRLLSGLIILCCSSTVFWKVLESLLYALFWPTYSCFFTATSNMCDVYLIYCAQYLYSIDIYEH